MELFNIDIDISKICLIIAPLGTLIIAWLTYNRSKSKIQFTEVIFSEESQYGSAFIIQVINNGKKPVKITNVSLIFKNKIEQALRDEYSSDYLKYLDRSKYIFTTYDKPHINPLDLRKIIISDTHGKKIKYPSRKIKNLIKH